MNGLDTKSLQCGIQRPGVLPTIIDDYERPDLEKFERIEVDPKPKIEPPKIVMVNLWHSSCYT